MGLFKRKPDPITERAKLLNQQIAALQEEIQQLESRGESKSPADKSSGTDAELSGEILTPFSKKAAATPTQPRLRSTVLPPGQPAPANVAVAQTEPVFEEVGSGRIQSDEEQSTPAHYNELGVRKYDIASAWRRLKNHFRGPVTSNPKLVHYLSAGSIQGLRPLRYEKRVARNRFVFFAVVLLGVLWGLIAIIAGR